MQKRYFLSALMLGVLTAYASSAVAEEKFKIGLILPMTGPFCLDGQTN